MRKSPKMASYVSFNNRQHKNPSPEDMNPNNAYAFTYNPKIQPLTPQFKLDLITWHNGMVNIFGALKYAHINVKLELSQGSRWHYHGYIKITEVMKFYIYDLPILRENGCYEIDTINNEITWMEYCTKQQELMKPICKEYGIPYEHDNLKVMKVKVQPLNDTKFTELLQLEDTEE